MKHDPFRYGVPTPVRDRSQVEEGLIRKNNFELVSIFMEVSSDNFDYAETIHMLGPDAASLIGGDALELHRRIEACIKNRALSRAKNWYETFLNETTKAYAEAYADKAEAMKIINQGPTST